MKKYINFINENKLTDFLKKSFKNTIILLEKNQQEKVINLIDKINLSSDFKNSITLTTSFFRSNLNSNLNDINDMKKYLKSDLISTDIALKTLSKKYGNDLLLPKNFFSESNNNLLKKVFIQDFEKDFIQNLDLSIKIISEQLMKNIGMTEDEINKLSSQKINEADEIQHLQNTDKLDDIDENTESSENQEDKTENKEKEEQIEKIRKSYNNFQRNSLYEPLIKKLDEINKEREKQDPNKF